jgi:hypothetical protein
MAMPLPGCLQNSHQKWRTAFSHIRGGSYNRAVVRKSLPE